VASQRQTRAKLLAARPQFSCLCPVFETDAASGTRNLARASGKSRNGSEEDRADSLAVSLLPMRRFGCVKPSVRPSGARSVGTRNSSPGRVRGAMKTQS